jgi:hypothetical protein
MIGWRLQRVAVGVWLRRRATTTTTPRNMAAAADEDGAGGGPPAWLQRSYARPARREAPDDGVTAAYGWFLLAVVGVVYVAGVYAAVVSKLVPETGHYLLDWARADRYYCLMVPCSWVVTVLTVYLNWLGMKFFRHS